MFGSSSLVHTNVAEHAVGKAELCRELCNDRMVGQRFKQWLNHFVAPLKRPVGRGHRAACFKLRRCRQQVNAVGPVLQNRRHSRIWVDHDKHVELFHRRLHFFLTGLRVWRVAPQHHGPYVIGLVDVLGIFQARRQSNG